MKNLSLLSVEEAKKELAQYRKIGKNNIAFITNGEFNMVLVFGCSEVKNFPIDKPIEYFTIPGCVCIGKTDSYLLIDVKAREKEVKLAISFVKSDECIEAFYLADFIALISEKAPKKLKVDLSSFAKLSSSGALMIDSRNFFNELKDIIKITRVALTILNPSNLIN